MQAADPEPVQKQPRQGLDPDVPLRGMFCSFWEVCEGKL